MAAAWTTDVVMNSFALLERFKSEDDFLFLDMETPAATVTSGLHLTTPVVYTCLQLISRYFAGISPDQC